MAANSDPSAKYDPPITVTTVRAQADVTEFAEGDTMDSNIWTKHLLDTYGFQLKNTWVTDSAGYKDKLNVTIASGDLPDFFKVDATQFKQLADAGSLADLTDVYNTFASDLLKGKLNEDGGNTLKAATIDGKLMALPYVTATMDGAGMVWIRKDWLDNLSLSAPKTMDDLLAISKAFKNNDPDKNGKNDTVGLGITKDIFTGYGGLNFFLNSFHSYGKMWIEDPKDKSKLVYGAVQPEAKKALSTLQEMYNAGEIDKEFSVKTSTQLTDDIVSGKVGMAFGTMANPINYFSKSVAKDPKAKWEMYQLTSVDDQPVKAQISSGIGTFWVASKKSKYPDALVKTMDAFVQKLFSDKAEFKFMYDGPNLKYHTFKYMDVQAWGARKNLDAYLAVNAALKSNEESKLNPEQKGYYDQVKAYQGGDAAQWGTYKVFGPEGSLGLLENIVKDNLMYPDQYFSIPTDTMVQRQSTLSDLLDETYMGIILGDSVDTFDGMVTKWNQLGGEEMTKQVNEWKSAQQ
ncbi:putative ABC transporter peptide-binding protein YtcQ [Paenibacillus nasutitermitis]|uniref:ABC transporter peptide-binding protein YtcQ n=1 Tax=Paenibacillus nasutitermitis TaxID=1652958 RepID=A0A917DPV5_9BACL|nr:putative ABC transporter peptide-binding protein YtcQ [Paenibacillus nasutitermitis]